MGTLTAVALGGAAGAVLRYGLTTLVQAQTGAGFPWGTLSVNLIGSFLMGIVFAGLERGYLPPEMQAQLAVGLLGSFTTFSAFSLETLKLLETGAWGRASAYMAGSVALGLLFVYLGIRLVERGAT